VIVDRGPRSTATLRRWVGAFQLWLESDAGPDELSRVAAELIDRNLDFYPARKFPDVAPRHARDEFFGTWSSLVERGRMSSRSET
jgi:hypothetical protein